MPFGKRVGLCHFPDSTKIQALTRGACDLFNLVSGIGCFITRNQPDVLLFHGASIGPLAPRKSGEKRAVALLEFRTENEGASGIGGGVQRVRATNAGGTVAGPARAEYLLARGETFSLTKKGVVAIR